MSDPSTFELRLADAFERYADRAPTDFDVTTLVASAAAGTRGVGRRWWTLREAPPLVPLLMLALLLLALVTAVIGVGAQLLRDRALLTAPSPAEPTITEQVPSPREGATATLLADGRVLIVGGLMPAEVWDPSSGRTTFTGRTSVTSSEPIAVPLRDGRVLVVGDLPAAELFDPLTGTFSATGSTHEVRSQCHCGVRFLKILQGSGVLLSDGRVFIAGGNALREIYDPVSGAFTKAPTTGCDTSRSAMTLLRDARILIICLETTTEDAVLYDPVTNTFLATGKPTTSNAGAASLLPDGRVLLTGEGLQQTSEPAEIYDPSTGTFRRLQSTTNPSPFGAVVSLNSGRVLFVSGATPSPTLFDPVSEAFTSVDPPVAGTTAVQLRDGRVLVIGPTTSQLLDPNAWH